MPGAAPAYRYDAAPRRASRPDVRVVRASRQEPGVSASLVATLRFAAVALVLFAVVGCVSICLRSATVTTAMATEHLTEQVSAMQAYAASLEVEESSLANPSYMRSVAVSQLGMVPATQTSTLEVERDVVCYDQDGNLSLSGSLSASAQG